MFITETSENFLSVGRNYLINNKTLYNNGVLLLRRNLVLVMIRMLKKS